MMTGQKTRLMSEINVTPFIDFMLVLLIIFMVAAPLATVDVKVNLPASSSQPQPRPEKPLFLTVKADRSLAIGNDTIAARDLGRAVEIAMLAKVMTTSLGCSGKRLVRCSKSR